MPSDASKSRVYRYVGPSELATLASSDIPRIELQGRNDVRCWAEAVQPDELVATYVVRLDGTLVLTDRHAEHVACARGQAVLAAGEIGFSDTVDPVVEFITNQSTGYCPEPDCFAAVARALRVASLEGPDEFSHSFEFRRCCKCAAIHVIKDGVFECSQCEAELPGQWNFG